MITPFSNFRYVDPFKRYLRSKSKVVKNRAEFWTFSSRILLGWPFQKYYPCYHACLAARSLVKFHEVIPTNPNVIGVNTRNFKPHFKRSPFKFLAGTPVTILVCANKPMVNSSACSNLIGQHLLRAEMYSREKSTCVHQHLRLFC